MLRRTRGLCMGTQAARGSGTRNAVRRGKATARTGERQSTGVSTTTSGFLDQAKTAGIVGDDPPFQKQIADCRAVPFGQPFRVNPNAVQKGRSFGPDLRPTWFQRHRRHGVPVKYPR